jgi:hypothetical protein
VSAGKLALPFARLLARGLAELEFDNESKLIPITASKHGVFLIVVDLLNNAKVCWR